MLRFARTQSFMSILFTLLIAHWQNAGMYTDKQNKGGTVSEASKNNNQTLENSGLKVAQRALLLMHIRSESFRIPRAPVTFTVSVTVTGTAKACWQQHPREQDQGEVGGDTKGWVGGGGWYGVAASQSLQITKH